MSSKLARFLNVKGSIRLLAAVTLLSLLAACGGEEEAPREGGRQIDVAEFCEGYVEGENAFTRGPETDEQDRPTEEGLEQFRRTVEPFVAQVEENAPQEIESEVETVLDGVRETLDSGDPAATQTPEFVEAETAVDEYVYDNCEFDAKQEFVAVNYAYQQVPQTLGAGRTAFRMDNRGTEVHEAVIFKVNDPANRPIPELVDQPHDQPEQNLEFKGVAFAAPGTTSYAVVDLEAGRYAFVCFIPVGTTSLDQLLQEEEGAASPGASPGATASPGGAASPTSAATPTSAASASPTRAAATPTPAATGSPGAGEAEGEEPPPHFRRGMLAEVTVS